MVDRKARDSLANEIDEFLADRTPGHVLARVGRSLVGKRGGDDATVDRAIRAVAVRLWHCVSEVAGAGRRSGGPLTDRFGAAVADELRDDERALLERCSVFLRSDRNLEWPEEEWDPYEAVGPGLSAKGLMMLIGAGIAGMAGLGWLASGAWWAGVLFLVVAVGLSLSARAMARQAAAAAPPRVGDRSAFPFRSLEEYAGERRRQGRTWVGPARQDSSP